MSATGMWERVHRVTVRGIPQAQGSVRAFVANGRAIVATEGNRTNSPLGAWRSAIATEARAVYGDEPITRAAVKVEADILWPRPKSHYRASDPERGLRDDAPRAKPSKPDADKCARALLDALAGIAFADDAQVVSLTIRKGWGETPGALIVVSEFPR